MTTAKRNSVVCRLCRTPLAYEGHILGGAGYADIVLEIAPCARCAAIKHDEGYESAMADVQSAISKLNER